MNGAETGSFNQLSKVEQSNDSESLEQLNKVNNRFDDLEVRASNKELKEINREEITLKAKLELLKELEREKRMKESQKAVKRLEEEVEATQEVDIPDGKMAEMINELIEAHDKEIGTAVEIGKNEKGEKLYALVHASESAAKLVLGHNKIDAKNLSTEELRDIFEDAGLEVDKNAYKKDQIPKGRVFSEVIKDGWEVEAESGQKELVENGTNGRFAVENLMQDGKSYESLLEKLYGVEASEEGFAVGEYRTKIKLKVLNEDGSRKSFVSARKKIEIVSLDVGKFSKGENRVWGELAEGGWVALSDAAGITANAEKVGKEIPKEVQRLFSLQGEVDLSKREAMKEFRKGSTKKFVETVEKSNLEPDEKAELIAAFKVLDVSYARIHNGSSLEREATLNSFTKLDGGKKVEQLFGDALGFDTSWKVFYENLGKKNLGKTPDKHKGDVENILRGGEVFMLRVDQATHGSGKLEARIDQSNGDAWADNIDAPEHLRSDKEYIYKYLELHEGDKKAVLEKYLKRDVKESEVSNYEVAQVEIPNCENPAIVVKKIVVLEKKNISLTAVQYFRNVPGGWSLMFRVPDWFTSEAQRNYLPDPAIVSLEGKTLRKGEYLNARKRLDPKPKKHLGERIYKVLGIGNRPAGKSMNESLENYLNKKDIESLTNRELILEARKELELEMRKAGDGGDLGSFVARMRAKEVWEANWEARGFDKRKLQLVETLSDYDASDFEDLKEKITREEEAHELVSYLRKNKSLGSKSALEASERIQYVLDKHGVSLENVTVQEAIEQALYDEDKLDVARQPEFIGDAVVVPPTSDRSGEKMVIWESKSSISKEMLNVHSPLSLLIEATSLFSGYVVYLKTGIGQPDELVEKYLEKVEAAPDVEKKFREIFGSTEGFENFRDFIMNGRVPEIGGNKISIPLNEISLLIPGCKLLKDLFGGGEAARSATGGGSTGGGAGGTI